MYMRHYINNDFAEGDSAFCQPKETLLTEVLVIAIAHVRVTFFSMGQLKLLPFDVTIDYIVNKSLEV